MLLSFKAQGARLMEASFSDHGSLVAAVRQVDAVICTIAGVHICSYQPPLQLKLAKATKEVGNIKARILFSGRWLKRSLPSEFGIDPVRMRSAVEPSNVAFEDKMAVSRAVEEAGIPFTYISAGYFASSLCEPGTVLPATERVTILGSGDVKGGGSSI